METSEQYTATPLVNFVSVNDKNLVLFLAYRISSPIMNAFLVLVERKDSKGMYKYLFSSF